MSNENVAKFGNRLSECKTEIITLLRGNDDITKLLYYDEADALDGNYVINSKIKNEVYRQTNSDNQKVFLKGFDPETVKKTGSQIYIRYDNVNPITNSVFKELNLQVVILVSSKINTLSDYMTQRHDMLFQLLNDTIEGQQLGNVGYIKLMTANESVLSGNTTQLWILNYMLGELAN